MSIFTRLIAVLCFALLVQALDTTGCVAESDGLQPTTTVLAALLGNNEYAMSDISRRSPPSDFVGDWEEGVTMGSLEGGGNVTIRRQYTCSIPSYSPICSGPYPCCPRSYTVCCSGGVCCPTGDTCGPSGSIYCCLPGASICGNTCCRRCCGGTCCSSSIGSDGQSIHRSAAFHLAIVATAMVALLILIR